MMSAAHQVASTGIRRRSNSSRNSASARARRTPLPTKISGRSARLSASMISRTCAARPDPRRTPAALGGIESAAGSDSSIGAACTSSGISIHTGPGPPVARQVDGLLQVVADARGVQHGHRVLGDRLDDRDDVDFLHAQLPHAERRAIGGEHAVGALHLTGEKQHGVESSHAPATPVMALVPPGTGGHQGDAEIVGGLGVVLGRDGAGLLVRVADRFEIRHRASDHSGAWRRRRSPGRRASRPDRRRSA